jgi:hypothetical protein
MVPFAPSHRRTVALPHPRTVAPPHPRTVRACVLGFAAGSADCT